MRASHLIILLVLNFFWAATLSSYKIIEAHLAPGGIVTMRFAVSFVTLALLWPWLPGNAPRGRDLLKAGAIGLFVFCIGQRLQVHANHSGTAGNSSVLMGLEPLVASVAAAIFLREHIGPRRWIGFVLGIAGVVVVNAPWRAEFQWVSVGTSLLFIASFVGEAGYSVIGKPMLSRVGSMKLLAVALLAGTVFNLAIDGRETIAAAAKMPLQPWLIVIWLAIVCTVIGYSFWFVVIRESDVSVAALTIFSQPIYGVILAGFWVGEPLHWGQLWGGLVIATGLVVGLSRQIKPSSRNAADTPA